MTFGGAPERDFHAATARLLRGQPAALAPADLPTFVAWASRHRVAPYLGHVAASCDPALAPALAPARTQAAAVALLRDVWLGRLLRAATERGLGPVLFKGLGVAHLAYPAPALRPLGDVDLFLPRGDLRPFVELAMAHGFAYDNPDPAVVAYYFDWIYAVQITHPQHGLLEAHHGLYRDVPAALTDEILARLVPCEHDGVALRAFCPADLFVVLATHFGISKPGSCFMWLLDLALLGRGLSADEWRQAAATTRAHGLQVFVAAALALLRHLWDVAFPAAGDAPAAIDAALSRRERAAVAALPDLAGGAVATGDSLSLARRLSGREVNGRLGVLTSLLCHPGAVCEDLGVSSRSPWFPLHRARHATARAWRALRAVTG